MKDVYKEYELGKCLLDKLIKKFGEEKVAKECLSFYERFGSFDGDTATPVTFLELVALAEIFYNGKVSTLVRSFDAVSEPKAVKYGDEVYNLANYFVKSLKATNPAIDWEAKFKAGSNKWLRDFQHLIKEYGVDEVIATIDYAHRGSDWHWDTIVISPEKLKTHFLALNSQATKASLKVSANKMQGERTYGFDL